MSRYYFHVHNGAGLVLDHEGVELRSLEQARLAAVKGARSLISADVEAGLLDLNGRIEVVDASGTVVMVVAFRDAVVIRDLRPAQRSA